MVVNAKSPPALAVIRSLGRKNIEVTGASDSINDFPLYSKYCKNKILLRTGPDDTENRIDELYEIIKNHHYEVFLPVMSEKMLMALSQHKDDFEKHTRLPIPSFSQFSVLSNKAEVARMLSASKFPAPKSYFIESDQALETIKKEAAFPVLIKPHRGEGAEGIRIISDPQGLSAAYHAVAKTHGPCLVQEFVHGPKHTAVFLVNHQSEPRRFFVHRAIREYPLSGGPTCFLESKTYAPIFEYGLKLLKMARYFGLVNMEFIIDERDGKPKIIDVNPRFYGPVQGAITAGVDFPYSLFRMALLGDIETDFSYREGVKCRHLLYADTLHLVSVLRGAKSLKYNLGKTRTVLNFLKFWQDDSYFILSLSDPRPALKKIFARSTVSDFLRILNR